MRVSGPTILRISRAVASPSISGIFQSRKQMSKGLFSWMAFSRPSLPLKAYSVFCPSWSSRTHACSQVSLSSSITKARSSSKLSECLAESLEIPKGRSIVKVLPLPSSLWTSILPPIKLTRLCVIASPKPVPPKCWAISAVSCSKGRNTRLKNSFFMPIPLSLMTQRKWICSGLVCFSDNLIVTLPPRGVNLTALAITLINTWLTRSGSPTRHSWRMSFVMISKLTPFSLAWGSIKL